FLKPPYQEIKKGAIEDIKFESKAFYVETDFQPAPPSIRPLDKADEPDFTNNFLKLGIGRFVAPTAQLYINNGKERNVDYGLSFTHKSTHQDPVPLRRYREDYGSLEGKFIEKEYTGLAKFSLYNTGYFFYAGDDTTIFPGTTDVMREDSLRMGFTSASLDGMLFSNYQEGEEYFYNAGVQLNILSTRLKTSELGLLLKPTGGYHLTDEVDLILDTEIGFTRGTFLPANQNRFFFEGSPAVAYDNGTVRILGGITYNHFKNNIDSTGFSNLGPRVAIDYTISPFSMVLQAGYIAGMDQNLYRDMIHDNRYLGADITIRPTITNMHIYAGAKGNLGQAIDFAVRGFYKRIENQLIYRTFDSYRFTPVYDSLMTQTGVHAEANYDLNEQLKFGMAANISVFNTSNQDTLTARYFSASPIRFDIFATYKWEEKLTARGDLYVYGPAPLGEDGEGNIIQRNPFIDIRLYADYQLTPAFSVYAGVDNLLSTQYQRWINYPERPISIQAGLTLAF
ncbi:MAG: hypothetical protein AAFV07_07670, partial [Bacteroidota bacterium]